MKRRSRHRPRSSKDLAHLITRSRGRKGVKDEALAEECRIVPVKRMYQHLGQKLLLIPRSGWFELEPEKPIDDRKPARRTMVFTFSGVAMITAWLDTDRSREVGLALTPLLSTRRRSSKNKQPRPRRRHDPPRQANYERIWTRLQLEVRKTEEKVAEPVSPAKVATSKRKSFSAGSVPAPSGSPGRSRTRRCRAP